MTRFIDLHLCVPFSNIEKQKRMLVKASELGYRLVGIPIPSNASSNDVKNLSKICREIGLDFVTRVDLDPKNPGELLKDLRRLRRSFEIVSVLCASKPVARQAAKDHRVDLLSFPATKTRDRFFDSAEAELASESSASLEIDLAPIISLKGFSRTRLISILIRELVIAKSFHVPIVISSGANKEFLLRSPQDYAALTLLFDLDSSLALSGLSEVPLTIVERNTQKLSTGFVMPGLWVVKRGKDHP